MSLRDLDFVLRHDHQYGLGYSALSYLASCLDCGHATLEWCISDMGIGPSCILKLVIP